MNPAWIGWVSVVGAACVESAGQLAFKRAADGTAADGSPAGWQALRRNPGWMGFGASCFLLEALFFGIALRMLDVSVVFPAGSLTFVGVALMSRLWLGELVGIRRWAGIFLILCGIVLLGMR